MQTAIKATWKLWIALLGILVSAIAYPSEPAPKAMLEDTASEPAQKTSNLPEILLIGDSVRQLYCPHVAAALKGRAEVKWPNGNCQNSQYVLSASHMAFGSIRMEPVFFALGQAAGTAASMAAVNGAAVQDVPYAELRERLDADGQVITLKK